MSYFIKFLSLTLCLFIILTSCEDTKKHEQNTSIDALDKTKSLASEILNNEKIADSLTVVNADKISETLEEFPPITKDNVVEFLTEYGKNNPEKNVRFNTSLGTIEVTLYDDTPLHRANFIYLVKQKYFNTTFFHRVVPNFIIQAGTSDNRDTQFDRARIGKNYRIPNEIKKGRIHKKGTLSGAKYYRDNDDNMTEPFEFFIFLGPQKSTRHLNGNYTIFGEVTKGMDIVEKIADVEHDDQDWPLINVTLTSEIIK